MARTHSSRGMRAFIVLVVLSMVNLWGVSGAQETSPGITFTKTATPAVIHAGDDVTFGFTVVNTGAWPLRITIGDEMFGEIVTNYVLDNGASQTFTVVAAVDEDVTNVAAVTGYVMGSDVITDPVTATAQASVDVINPDISVTKTPSAEEAAPGDIVEYTIEVTNTGDTPLTVEVEDTVFGILAAGLLLEPDESETLGAEHHVYETVSNTVTAVGVDVIDGVVFAEATATVTVVGDDVTPPVLTEGPAIVDITESSAAIVWDTDEPADSVVRYDTRAGLLEYEVGASGLVTHHVVVLDGLRPATTYHLIASSADAAGNRTESDDLSFATAALPGEEPPVAQLVTPLRWETAAPVFVDVERVEDIDRVEFFVDGVLVYADHSPPFQFNVDTTQFVDGPHLLTTRTFDWAGLDSTDTATIDVANLKDAATPNVIITWPVEDEVVSGKINMKVDLSDDVGLFKGTIRVDGQWFGDWYPDPGKPATALSIEFPWDTRLNTNDGHRLAFEIYDTDLNYNVDVVDVYVNNVPPPPPPKLAVSRSVVRHQNYFTIDLTVKNVGGSPALGVRLEDYLQLFQPISRTAGSVTYTASYKAALTSWRMRIDDSVDLAAGQQRTYRYDAVPVLVYPGSPTPMIGGDKYSPSLGTTNTWYEDATGQNHYDVHHLLYSPSQAGSTYSDALATADYLLVTSPENLFRLNPEIDTNALLSSMANLARLENGVLGYLDVPASFPLDYDQHDAIATGDVGRDGRAEVVIGDLSADRVIVTGIPTTPLVVNNAVSYEVKWANHSRFEVGSNDEGFDAGDRIVVGNVFGGLKDQIVMADASADVFFAYDGQGTRQGNFIISESGVIHDIESFDGLAAGNVVPGGRDEVVFADRSANEVYVLQFLSPYPNDPFTTQRQLGVVTQFSTNYEAHDGLAVGDVMGDATEEIVLADRSGNRIYIFSYQGWLLGSFAKTFDEGDGLAVASAVSTYPDKAEIIISDASADRVDAYTATGTLLSSVDRDVEGFDGLAAGTITGSTVAEVVVADRSMDSLDFHDLFRESADKYVLRDLLKANFNFGIFSGLLGPQATGAWSTRLSPDFVGDGYLLIVGETDVVPAWRGKTFGSVYTTRGTVALVADVTDYPYASTYGDEIVPELAMGRIIGNTAAELRKPIEASIGVITGAAGYGFDRSHSFVVSGYAAGLGGGADKIDFKSEALSVALTLKNKGIDPIFMDTSINTVYQSDGTTIDVNATRAAIVAKFFANTPGKDVVFLAGHGSGDGWDQIGWSDVLAEANPFGGTTPFVLASSCSTGQYFHAFSVANSFLSRGAGAYVGATKWGLGTHSAISKLLYKSWDAGESVGELVREVKQTIGFDVYPTLPYGGGGSTTAPDIKEQYWIALYHVFGDPKFGWQGPPTASTASFATGLSAPPDTLVVDVPAFEVDDLATGTQLSIPGGGAYAVDGLPTVPYYSVYVEIPAGYEVQDVVLTESSEPQASSGIVIAPLVEAIGEDDLAGASVPAGTANDEWWPNIPFGWDVVSGPEGDRLAITVFPIAYRAATTEVEFTDHYAFDIVTTPSSTEIQALVLEQTFGLDPVSGTVRFGDGEHGSVPDTGRDLVVATYVRDRVTGDLVSALPLRTLRSVRGSGEFTIEWQPGEVPPGDYDVEVRLQTTDGSVLDHRNATVTVGEQPAVVNGCDGSTPTIVGTEGDDILYGTPGDDVIVGLGGDDVIYGGGGNDVICGGDGDDVIDGGDGDDVIDGGDGDDTIDPGIGSDTLRGGPGEDVARLDADPSGVNADLAAGLATSRNGIEATLAGFENLAGGSGPDHLTGDAGRNIIWGGAGDDVIDAGGGDDTVLGGNGADVVHGGPGGDDLQGLNGDDHLYGDDGDDVIDGGNGKDTIVAGEGDDTIAAGNGDDAAYGGPGDDDMYGDNGDDALFGEVGDDYLEGGNGTDVLVGGAGDDIVVGGAGRDLCDAEVMRSC